MKPLSVRSVLLVIVASGLVAGLLTAAIFNMGLGPLTVTPFLGLLCVVLAAALIWNGRQVRRLKQGEPTRMTPMLAMRVAVAARASALVGAGCFGVLAAITLVSVLRPSTSALQMAAMWAGIDAAGALVWAAASFVVERWCVIDNDDSSEDHPTKPGSSGKSTPTGSPA